MIKGYLNRVAFFFVLLFKIITMAYKKKVSNKSEKVKPANKAIDWVNMSEYVEVVTVKSKHLITGSIHTVTKATAKVLVEKGAVKLK